MNCDLNPAQNSIVITFDCAHTLAISLSHAATFRTNRAFADYVRSLQCPQCGKHAQDFAFDGYLR